MAVVYWDVSAMSSGMVAVSVALFAAVVAFGGALIPGVPANAHNPHYIKAYFAVGAAAASSGIATVLWVGVSSAKPAEMRSVLAVFSTCASAIAIVAFVLAVTLVIDAARPADSRSMRALMWGLIYFQRMLMVLCAIGVAYVVSAARNDVQPHRPLSHMLLRMCFILLPLIVVRPLEMLIRYAASRRRHGRAAAIYHRAREMRAVPGIYAAAASCVAAIYFSIVWTTGSADHGALADLFGRTQGRLVIVAMGLCFALFELAFNADTMATLYPARVGLVATSPAPPRDAHIQQVRRRRARHADDADECEPRAHGRAPRAGTSER